MTVLSFIVVFVQVMACLGYGLLFIRLVNILDDLSPGEIIAFSFAIGIGILGWLLFFLGAAGLIDPVSLLSLSIPGLASLYYFRDKINISYPQNFGLVGYGLLAIFCIVILFDLLEALSPPGDADSLAYHFAMLKKFKDASRIVFEPRAIDGAVPFLVQMTYLPAFSLGGELALTLWTFITGLTSGVLLFVLLRRHLSFEWSFATSLIFLTIPGVVIGAGSGQVEIRNALFVMIAAFAVARTFSTNLVGYIILAGVAAGFFAATKYLGLFFVLACGLVLVFRRGWFNRGVIYSLAVCIAGFQWYFWNWLHTGDPVFPALSQFLGTPDSGVWSPQHQAGLKTYLSNEIAIPVDLASFFVYPFLVTFKSIPTFDSLRAGFGPYPILLIPFAAIGVWKRRQRVFKSPLFTYAIISVLYYALWFFSGSTQRLRHLLPILPIVLICLSVAAYKFSEIKSYHSPLMLAAALTLVIQISGHFLFSLKSAQYVFGNETRREYLTRTVSWFEPVDWINSRLSHQDKVLTTVRWYGYLFDVPYYWAHPHTQVLINLLPGTNNFERFVKQIRSVGITHILPWPEPINRKALDQEPKDDLYASYIFRLKKENCLLPVETFKVRSFWSRTLSASNFGRASTTLYKFNSTGCRVGVSDNKT